MAAKIRIKCPHCSEAFNISAGTAAVCPECKQPINVPNEGWLYLYRQGSPLGIAGGFGIYLNNVPFGYIGNTELLCIPLPYGSYNIHCAVGMNRKCTDMLVNLTPEAPVAYAKVYMKMGFWSNPFVVEPVDPKLLDL